MSCSDAAKRNDFAELRRLHTEKGLPLSMLCTTYAANNNNVEMMKYLVQHRCPMDLSSGELAAHHGHVEILRYLHKDVAPFDAYHIERIAEIAIDHGDVKCLEFVHETSRLFYRQNDIVYIYAAQEQNWTMFVHWWRISGQPWDMSLMNLFYEVRNIDLEDIQLRETVAEICANFGLTNDAPIIQEYHAFLRRLEQIRGVCLECECINKDVVKHVLNDYL